MTDIDATHDPHRRSWLTSANGHADFPIQNLPLGVCSTADDPAPRGGVAIGDRVLDLAAVVRAGVFTGAVGDAVRRASLAPLNAFMAEGASVRRRLRTALSDALTEGAPHQTALAACLRDVADCTLHLPAAVGDYTDFYAGIHHALNVGRQFRPDQPLLPNYKWVPIGYHGRASSVVVSGAPVRRPMGQRRPTVDGGTPVVGPSTRLDYELELGVWMGAGNRLGTPVPIGEAASHIAGFCLLNDWSARDIQAWEYQPLGPFLSKSFVTSVSPWVVMPEALAPFRIAQASRPEGDPSPLPYLHDGEDQRSGAFDITLEVLLHTPCLKSASLPPHRLARSSTRHLYWTVAQLVAHHTSNGCNLRPGDLLGSGTISTPDDEGVGSLLELTGGGARPVTLATGSARTFLEDGDEVIIRARAERAGCAPVGFGEVRGTVQPAVR